MKKKLSKILKYSITWEWVGIVFIAVGIISIASIMFARSPVKPRNIETATISLNVSTNSLEKLWMNALALQLHGKTEQPVTMGRVDVLTDTSAIEIDFLHKWHESIGQALHYAIETKKQPVIALISLTTNDAPKIAYIQSICNKLNIELVILTPE